MTEAARIADELRRAYEGEAWHGPALGELLAGVTAEQARQKPVAGAHSLWELVLHITTWQTLPLRRVGGETVEATPEQDWPTVADTSEAAWQRALAELEQSNRRLREAVEKMDDRRLDETVPGKDYSFYVMLHGVAQHCAYHAGQIAVVKKALR